MKLKFKKPKSQLDEMQEQQFQKSGNTGMRIAIVSLIAVIVIQGTMGAHFSQIIGEFVVIQILCIYGIITSWKNGIWSCFLKPNLKNHFWSSLCTGVITSLLILPMSITQGPALSVVLDCTIACLATFSLTFTFLVVGGAIFKKRISKLENDIDEED